MSSENLFCQRPTPEWLTTNTYKLMFLFPSMNHRLLQPVEILVDHRNVSKVIHIYVPQLCIDRWINENSSGWLSDDRFAWERYFHRQWLFFFSFWSSMIHRWHWNRDQSWPMKEFLGQQMSPVNGSIFSSNWQRKTTRNETNLFP